MISSNKLSMPSQISLNNISKVLSRNMLGIILGFSNINDLLCFIKLNRKFKKLIENATILPIFSLFIKEIEYIKRFKNAHTIIIEGNKPNLKPSYITLMRNSLLKIYNFDQVEDFLTEIIKNILTRLNQDDGKLDLSADSLNSNSDDFRILCAALKVNKTIKELSLLNNHIYGEVQQFLLLTIQLILKFYVRQLRSIRP